MSNKTYLLPFIILLLLLKNSLGQTHEKTVLKSFNFKLYYTEGGDKLATSIIEQAENNLETIENFLGTRLVEQIDIFLTESPVANKGLSDQRNGNVQLDNSSIYLTYRGSTAEIISLLRERLAEILIVDMLYGNTIKERLKNNREMNVPDWYIPGLARFVAGFPNVNSGWMADYYEGKLSLNLNLSTENELKDFGLGVFNYINDTFGINKLRQILFYTKLSGKTEYAFQYVLNKSMNWVLADWYKLEKSKYFQNSATRLPADPEPFPRFLEAANIIDVQYSQDGNELDLLVKVPKGLEIWNYNIATRKAYREFLHVATHNDVLPVFVKLNNTYYLSVSDGSASKVFVYTNAKIQQTIRLPLNYVFVMKLGSNNQIYLLGQRQFQTDVFEFSIADKDSLKNLTNSALEEHDFEFDETNNLFLIASNNNKYLILNWNSNDTLYKSAVSISKLANYKESFLSFIQNENNMNIGKVVSKSNGFNSYQVTNYNRPLVQYDYNASTEKVMEGLVYGKKNYIVLSDASLEKIEATQITPSDSIATIKFQAPDSIPEIVYNYKFITGFEYKNKATIIEKIKEHPTLHNPIKIKVLTAPIYEFKPGFIKIGFTNSTFHTPLFPYFYPINEGLYNGANAIIGCGITDLYKKYSLQAHIRQPLFGKGTDFDFGVQTNWKHTDYGFSIFSSTYQRETYNQQNKYAIREMKVMALRKLRPSIELEWQLGYRTDLVLPLSESRENLSRRQVKLKQPFSTAHLDIKLADGRFVNYRHVLTLKLSGSASKILQLDGSNLNLGLALNQQNIFYRIFHLNLEFNAMSSVGDQKTVYLLGGVTNWLRPVYGNAQTFYQNTIKMYSNVPDFEGLPYNYRSGTSFAIGKIKFFFPLNPVLSQQNFNQNIFKYLNIKSGFNIGTAWYGQNPFSISNPENREEIETGSMTIINYAARNPLVWAWTVGANSVLFGYNIGWDYGVGYNDRGKIGGYRYLTIGKSF